MESRTRTLLRITLVSSLLVNALIIGCVTAVAIWWWSDAVGPEIEPGEPLTLQPVALPAAGSDWAAASGGGSDRDAGHAQPAAGALGSDRLSPIADDPLEALRQEVGLTPAEWQKVTEGEVVLRRDLDGGAVVVEGWFIARGTVDRALDILTNYPGISTVYPDVQRATVLSRGALWARVHYQARYGPIRDQWVVDERWLPDELTWKLVRDPKRSGKLQQTVGHWRLRPTGQQMLLLWYRNQLQVRGVPDALIRRMTSATIPGIAQRIRQELVK